MEIQSKIFSSKLQSLATKITTPSPLVSLLTPFQHDAKPGSLARRQPAPGSSTAYRCSSLQSSPRRSSAQNSADNESKNSDDRDSSELRIEEEKRKKKFMKRVRRDVARRVGQAEGWGAEAASQARTAI